MREHASPQTDSMVMPANAAGTGLKPEHAGDIFGQPRQVDFFEIHAENYMGRGGPPHHLLRRIRRTILFPFTASDSPSAARRRSIVSISLA